MNLENQNTLQYAIALTLFIAALYVAYLIPETPQPAHASPMRLNYLAMGLTLLCLCLLMRMGRILLGAIQVVIVTMLMLYPTQV